MNLLDNAITYAGDAPPRFHSSAEADDGHWRIIVRDEGVRIEAHAQESVFDVFSWVDPGDERPAIGIGLSERIVERHDGDIWVELTPGEGSRFAFTLPSDGDE